MFSLTEKELNHDFSDTPETPLSAALAVAEETGLVYTPPDWEVYLEYVRLPTMIKLRIKRMQEARNTAGYPLFTAVDILDIEQLFKMNASAEN